MQLSPLTARCMQLNRIKVISPTEVIASRWLPCRNMLLMKLLSHCGCVLVYVWRSKHELTRVCRLFGQATHSCVCLECYSTSLDGGWSFSCSIATSSIIIIISKDMVAHGKFPSHHLSIYVSMEAKICY